MSRVGKMGNQLLIQIGEEKVNLKTQAAMVTASKTAVSSCASMMFLAKNMAAKCDSKIHRDQVMKTTNANFYQHDLVTCVEVRSTYFEPYFNWLANLIMYSYHLNWLAE